MFRFQKLGIMTETQTLLENSSQYLLFNFFWKKAFLQGINK